MKEPAFEIHSIAPKETTIVSVKEFAQTFSDRDMKKVLQRHAGEQMEISSDLLLKMVQAPRKNPPTAKSSKALWLFLMAGVVFGVLFAPVITEQARLFGLGILAVGVSVGVYLGIHWKRIERTIAEAQKLFWEKQLENLEN